MDLKEIERRVLAGERPKLTPEVMEARKTDPILEGLIQIMERCWAQDPLARPPIDQVVRDLERLAEPADKGNMTTTGLSTTMTGTQMTSNSLSTAMGGMNNTNTFMSAAGGTTTMGNMSYTQTMGPRI